AVLASKNRQLNIQRHRAETNEALAIDAVKRFRDAVADEPLLKDSPALEDLRKRLLKEPLAFFRSLRDRLQADGDTHPEALARLAAAGLDLARLTIEIGNKQDALTALRESVAIQEGLAKDHPTVAAYRSDLAHSYHNLGLLRSESGDAAGA